MSLLWRVFLANVVVLLVALALLTFSPIEVSYPIKFGQFLLLFVGFVALVTMNLVLMRRVLAPLLRLTEVMTSIDPDTPGTRLEPEDPRSAEGAALAHAFNGMLDRLESARREAARTALEAQESERLRVAQELHDEIGPDADGRDDAGRARGRGRSRPMPTRRSATSRTRCGTASTRCAASPASCAPRRSTTSAS